MNTILSYKNKTVTIGPDAPFVIIGERINPTRRKKLAESMSQGDFSVAQEDARRQAAAGGAQVLDVNSGIPGSDEPALLRGLTQAVMQVAELPLCFELAQPGRSFGCFEHLPRQSPHQLHDCRSGDDGTRFPFSAGSSVQR